MHVFIVCKYAIGLLLGLTVNQYCSFCPHAGRAVPFAFDQKEPKILSKNNLCVFSIWLISPIDGFLTSPHEICLQGRLREKALRKSMERTSRNQVCSTLVRPKERRAKRRSFLILVKGIYFLAFYRQRWLF